MEEKLKMLHSDDTEPTQHGNPNFEQDFTSSHQDEDQLGSLHVGNDSPELRDVVLGRSIVLESEELPWIIDRIRSYESLLHTGKIFPAFEAESLEL
jgi:hypothetical protein